MDNEYYDTLSGDNNAGVPNVYGDSGNSGGSGGSGISLDNLFNTAAAMILGLWGKKDSSNTSSGTTTNTGGTTTIVKESNDTLMYVMIGLVGVVAVISLTRK